MTTLQRCTVIAVLIITPGIAIYEAHRASTLESGLQAVQGQTASPAAQAQQPKSQPGDTEHRPEGAERNSEPSNADRSELLRLRGEVGLLRRQLAAAEASPRPATNHIAFPGLYLPRDAWSDQGTDTPRNTILTMFWALRRGDQSKLEQMLSPLRGSQTLDQLTLPRDDWEKISAIQMANVGVTRSLTAGNVTQEIGRVEVIVEKAPPVGQTEKEVSMERWTRIKANDQWLILNSF